MSFIDKNELKKFEKYEGEFEEDHELIISILREISHPVIDTLSLKKELKVVYSFIERKNYEKGIDKLHDLVLTADSIRDLELILKEIDIIKSQIEEKSGNKIKFFTEGYKEIRNLCEKGRYEEAVNVAYELKTPKHLDVIEIPKEMWENKLERTRKKLRTARFSKLDLSKIKNLVKKGVKLKKNGQTKEGLKKLEEASTRLDKIFQISIKLEELREKMSEKEDHNLEFRSILNELNDMIRSDELEKGKMFLEKELEHLESD